MISLVNYKELNNNLDYIDIDLETGVKRIELISMKDNFQNDKYQRQDDIIWYLRNKGNVGTIYTQKIFVDFVSSQPIKERFWVRDDGFISWSFLIPYYIENYNLRLPLNIEKYILRKVDLTKGD